MAEVAERLRAKLEAAFAPVRLVVTDDSYRHAGHAGAREGGESHFLVEIESAVFLGLSRLERHRRVNAALATELAGPVHALQIQAFGPGER